MTETMEVEMCDSADGSTGEVTRMLAEWQRGDRASLDELSRVLYSELHRIAERYLRTSPHGTLQPTALVNEAYVRLLGSQATIQGRKHFFALSARMMRQILVDRARRHAAGKRGGDYFIESLQEDTCGRGVHAGIEEFLILDQALTRLAEAEPRLAQVVELHYFGGLSGVEIAEVLGVSPWCVTRDHRLAEAWLRRALSQR